MALTLGFMRKFSTTMKRIYRSKRLFASIVAMVLLSLTLFYVRECKVEELVVLDLNYTYRMLQDDLIRSIKENNGRGCVIPKLDPFDEEAMRFTQDLPKVVCKGTDWVECFLDECYVVKSVQAKYKNIYCVYRDILYVNDLRYVIGAPVKLSGDQKYKLRRSDHVKVGCIGTADVGEGPQPVRWFGTRAGLRRLPARAPSCCGPHLNVLILILDSTSRAGFLRKMPLTHVALKEMDAVFLEGYNIVGDGTPAALFPILTGKSELEFPEIRRKFTKDFIDDRSFIFRHLSKIGFVTSHSLSYRTAYFEDSPFLGTFQYRFNGFSEQPADHYLLSLLLEEYGEHSKSNSDSYCFGAMPLYGLLLNLTHQFLLLDGSRFALTFIADISHNNFNMISTADEDLAFFLRRIQQGGKMRETVLFVMGDHGTRFTAIRETLQGKLEERLPLMAIVLPKLLLNTRPGVLEALRSNAEALTTPFDIHSTLTDILGIGHLRNRYRVPGASMARGMTLLQPIPRSRSCGEAGALPQWCTCAQWRAAGAARAQAAAALARHVNDRTAAHREQCASRVLAEVQSVLRLAPARALAQFARSRDVDGHLGSFVAAPRALSQLYQARIVMSPGRAVFEGSMKYFPSEGHFAISDWDVSRIDPYGTESSCVSKELPHLAKYCYCIR